MAKPKPGSFDPAEFYNLVPGYGPQPADLMFVGEAPGRNENEQRRPFVGQAGDVLTTYCEAAEIWRPDCRFNNIYPYWPGPGNPEPTDEQIEDQAWRLEKDIKKTGPKVIAPLGLTATQYFLGDVKMEDVHGMPTFSPRFPDVTIVPCYHPAAGFYSPELSSLCQDDIFLLAFCVKNPAPPRPLVEIEVEEDQDPPHVFNGAVDTEGLVKGVLGARRDNVWGMSYSTVDGKAKVYIAKPGDKPPVIWGDTEFHNALHDLRILRGLGVDTSKIIPNDTMVRAYNLRLEPQGLKALAFRKLGLRMQDFDGLVRPHFNRVALDWLERASTLKYKKPSPVIIADPVQKRYRKSQPWTVERRLKHLIMTHKKQPLKHQLDAGWLNVQEHYRDTAEFKMHEPFPEFTIHHVPKDEAVKYAGEDAGATAYLAPILDREIDAKGLRTIYNLDRRAIRFVDRMQQTGMYLDMDEVWKLRSKLRGIRSRAKETIQKITKNHWFNPGSPDQVGWYLYDKMRLPVLARTEGGKGSSSDSALLQLRGYHIAKGSEAEVFIEAVRDYRESDKYDGTFIESMIQYSHQDNDGYWILGSNFRITRVISGRISASAPNPLAFPTRTDLGKEIRRCVIAPRGFLILSADLSQIELRTMAHHCGDETMKKAFVNGADLHAQTAAVIFKKALDKITKAERYVAKTLNFAIMYGITARALLEQFFAAEIFDYTLAQCEQFIKEWFKLYGSVRQFLDRLWMKAEKDGFVRNTLGRLCYVPNLRLKGERNKPLREAAQRLAGNFIIQSDASDLAKQGEIELLDWIDEAELQDDVRPFLQLHDEYDLIVKEELAPMVAKVVVKIMCQEQPRFRVPLAAEASYGRTWADAK